MKQNNTTGDKYKGIYRTLSTRWQDWDYGANAAYFVTICTANHVHSFGEIKDGEMTLTDIGQNANDYWTLIPAHFPFTILGAFVVMPNHVHGVIVIDKLYNDADTDCKDAINRVHTAATMETGGVTGNKNPMLYNNLSRILRWYKGRVAFESHKNHADFAWQTRFYDRVIRDYKELAHIEQYINANIFNWHNDELFG